MRKLFNSWIVRVAALMFMASASFAQDRVPFRQEELDQMLAPIALYPDSLLSQMLMASTYPLEVVQAARWSRANRSLKGEQAVKAVEGMDWDPSVKSLVAFPDILAQMDEKLDWTERLGEAFLAQQQDVMATVQDLRRRADARGNLKSNERMRVVREQEHIVIEPPAREVVYVPYYSPAVVYGPWWYPAYPPVYWGPPPAYYAWPAYGPAFFWGPAIGFSAGFFFGHFDWHHRHATVVHNNITNVYVNRRTVVNRSDELAGRRTAWRHDPAHRRGVPFRTAAARERFEEARTADRERRGADRGDATRGERRAEDNRTADLRQRRVDERRTGAPERRDDRAEAGGGRQPLNDGKRDERTKAAQPEARRVQPGNSQPDGRRAQGGNSQSDARQAQPDTRGAQVDSRGGQADTRQARPDSRGAQPDRDRGSGRSERSSGSDRRSDRTEPGNNVTRFQARSSDAPLARAETRSAARVDSRPSARPDTRAAVQAELQRRAHAAPAAAATSPGHAERRAQSYSGGHVRAARHFAGESMSAPRASAGASAPRMHAEPRASAGASAPRMHAEPRGGGGGREFNPGKGGGGRS